MKGTVLYAGDDEPLVGATVLPVGAGQGTATDIDGNFSLSLPSSVTKLKVSYVGMTTEEVNIVGTPPYNLVIKLTDSENKLDEVMVVAYGTAKKSAYTGAASVIDASVIEDRLVSNITNALSGTVAGVQTLSANGVSPVRLPRCAYVVSVQSTPRWLRCMCSTVCPTTVTSQVLTPPISSR